MTRRLTAPSGPPEPARRRVRRALRHSGLYRRLHLAYTGWRARHGGLPDWPALLGSTASPKPVPPHPKRVLVATGAGGHLPSTTIESLVAQALTARGHRADVLLCDGVLPACQMCEINWYVDVAAFVRDGPRDRCGPCFRPSAAMLDAAGLACVRLGATLTDADRAEAAAIARDLPRDAIPAYREHDVAVGEHALAGALRFFARGTLAADPLAGRVLRRYLEAAVLTHRATRRLLADGAYDVVVLNHGIYVPQGLIAETARSLGVRVVTWHPAYRRQCFLFNHDETYHLGLMSEPAASWESMPWSDHHRARIRDYLRSRWTGTDDWIRFHRAPEIDTSAIERATGVDFSRPVIGLLTNVVWDAQLHYPANAFPGMLEWLRATVDWFARHPDLQLLIRVHPAELTGTVPSRQPVLDELHAAFPSWPANVFVIGPESALGTYAAMAKCNAAIIYGTKTGVELAATGMPVIVAGEAWIRGKGVTLDAASADDYFALLDRLPLPARLDDATTDRALRYAYHFFFRRMIPLDCVEPQPGRWPPFRIAIDGRDALLPGRSRGLDVVCDGIVDGTPFVHPAETPEA